MQQFYNYTVAITLQLFTDVGCFNTVVLILGQFGGHEFWRLSSNFFLPNFLQFLLWNVSVEWLPNFYHVMLMYKLDWNLKTIKWPSSGCRKLNVVETKLGYRQTMLAVTWVFQDKRLFGNSQFIDDMHVDRNVTHQVTNIPTGP